MKAENRANDVDVAWQTWLALEREAVWLYPLIGARIPALTQQSRDALTAHRSTRDRLANRVPSDATTAQAAYEIGEMSSVRDGRAAAQSIEKRIQAACLTLLKVAPVANRDFALKGLRAAARAATAWGAPPEPFPGLE